jgi:3-isopropylmalate/(R)-2-methylmalate dehydratase small subunit
MRIALMGRARLLGDDINTDYIIASTRKRDTLDEQVLKRYLLETLDPAFAASVQPGDILVAGANFGCGSAMEIAATVILASGIRAVVARTLNRTFFRNAVNNGLLPVECDTSGISEGDRLSIVADDAGVVVVNATTGVELRRPALAPMVREILAAGGLVEHVRRQHPIGHDHERSEGSAFS